MNFSHLHIWEWKYQQGGNYKRFTEYGKRTIMLNRKSDKNKFLKGKINLEARSESDMTSADLIVLRNLPVIWGSCWGSHFWKFLFNWWGEELHESQDSQAPFRNVVSLPMFLEALDCPNCKLVADLINSLKMEACKSHLFQIDVIGCTRVFHIHKFGKCLN